MYPAATVKVHRLHGITIALFCLIPLGCSQEEHIQQYSIPKEKPRETSMAATSGDQVWFFKLTGPEDQVLPYLKPFMEIIRTSDFSGAKPTYDIPPGWQVSQGPPPRYETITIPDTDPPMEVTVSSLPAPQSNFDAYLQANVNRWRGQLGLDPFQGDDWRKTAEQQDALITVPAGNRTITMVNLTGETDSFGATRMLAAVIETGVQPPSSPAMPSPPSSAPASSPLTYDVPEGWEPSAGNAVRLASFKIPHSSGEVDVSVTRFPGGGDLLPNVNRWRGQIDLPPIEANDLEGAIEDITLDGNEASLVEINGPKESILVAIVNEGDAKWFFKAQGPVEAVTAEKEHFRQFLDSVKLGAR